MPVNPISSRPSVARALPNRTALVLATVLAAGALWIVQHRRLAEGRASLRQALDQQAALASRVHLLQQEWEMALQQRQVAERERDRVIADTVVIETQMAQEDPEHFWVSPPAAWRYWDEASPYIWLDKESLATLKPPFLTKAGRLRPEAVTALALEANQTRAVNDALAPILDTYRQLEIAHVERLEEPLPGIADDGPQVTIRIPPFPEQAGQLRAQFEDVIHRHLGEQRAELFLRASEPWMKEQFNTSADKSVTYSAVRHPNGTFNLSVNVPSGANASYGGNIALERYIPEHLLPAFEELRFPGSSEVLAEGNP